MEVQGHAGLFALKWSGAGWAGRTRERTRATFALHTSGQRDALLYSQRPRSARPARSARSFRYQAGAQALPSRARGWHPAHPGTTRESCTNQAMRVSRLAFVPTLQAQPRSPGTGHAAARWCLGTACRRAVRTCSGCCEAGHRVARMAELVRWRSVQGGRSTCTVR